MPLLNTASTADMSFMLLILFLVTTSMDVDKGLERKLPPADDETPEETVRDVNVSNVLRIELTGDNEIMVDDEKTAVGTLQRRVMAFVDGGAADREKHVISLTVDRKATYDAYFNMQNEIVAAYNALRERRARKIYNRPFSRCTAEQKDELRKYYPQNVAENYDNATVASQYPSVKGGPR